MPFHVYPSTVLLCPAHHHCGVSGNVSACVGKGLPDPILQCPSDDGMHVVQSHLYSSVETSNSEPVTPWTTFWPWTLWLIEVLWQTLGTITLLPRMLCSCLLALDGPSPLQSPHVQVATTRPISWPMMARGCNGSASHMC